MTAAVIVIIAMVAFSLCGGLALVWAVGTNQLQDVEEIKYKILED